MMAKDTPLARGNKATKKARKKKPAADKQSVLFEKQLPDAVHKEVYGVANELHEANSQFSAWSREVQIQKNKLAELLHKHKITKKYRIGDLVAVPKVTPEKISAAVEPFKE